MNICKKILANILCATILLSTNYYSKAQNPPHDDFTDLLTTQQQFDALYFYASYLKINSKTFAKLNMDSFRKKNIENMTQWRESFFTYIKNLISAQKALFFCYVYYKINPSSNIISCAPPTTITDFNIRLIPHTTSGDSTPEILSAQLTYSRIRTAKIMI